LGSCAIDFSDYLSKVANNNIVKSEYNLNYIFDKKGLSISLVVDISKVETSKQDMEDSKRPKKKKR